MRIEYNRLFDKLKENHITQKKFLNCGISGSTLNKLRNNQTVTTETICRICDYFQCMPDEIMEFIPDSDYEKKRQEKANAEKQAIEAQIAELQAKLKKMQLHHKIRKHNHITKRKLSIFYIRKGCYFYTKNKKRKDG